MHSNMSPSTPALNGGEEILYKPFQFPMLRDVLRNLLA